jgi:hypothetical protein
MLFRFQGMVGVLAWTLIGAFAQEPPHAPLVPTPTPTPPPIAAAPAPSAELTTFLEKQFEPLVSYTANEVSIHISHGRDLAEKNPAFVEEIRKHLLPWHAEASQLAAGKTKIEGAWFTPAQLEERRRREHEERIAAYERDHVRMEMDWEAISHDDMIIGISLTALLVFCLLFLVADGLKSKSMPLFFLGFAGVAAFAYFCWQALQMPDDYPQAVGDKNTVTSLLLIADGPMEQQVNSPTVALEYRDINAFIQQFLHIREPSSVKTLTMTRKFFRISLSSEAIQIFETVDFFGKTLVIRYSFPFRIVRNGLELDGCRGSIGKAPIPGKLASILWTYSQSDYDEMQKQMPVLKKLLFQKIEGSCVYLLPASLPPRFP